MTVLDDYRQFNGRHWETGSIANHFAYRGVTAPHTGQPISEALLLGISGGLVMGYFTFAYEGYDPQCNILTRNTFDPWDTMLARLGVVQQVEHTSRADKAQALLLDTLADGVPPIVWADMWSLPYNALACDEGMWGMFPLVVYGYDEAQETVWMADRAQRPLTVTPAQLARARGRVKKDKHRLITLDPPQWEKLPSAVRMGLCDCLKLYTEKPPRGAKNNFGLAAYQHWAKMLTHPKQRNSWHKLFPAGRPLWAGLTSAFQFGLLFGKNGRGERDTYAAFLDEAVVILDKPTLQQVAAQFRSAGEAWEQLGRTLLPDDIPLLGEARTLIAQQHQLFLTQGNESVAERRQINEHLDALKHRAETDFPLEAAEVSALQERIAAQLLVIHDLEAEAVRMLEQAL